MLLDKFVLFSFFLSFPVFLHFLGFKLLFLTHPELFQLFLNPSLLDHFVLLTHPGTDMSLLVLQTNVRIASITHVSASPTMVIVSVEILKRKLAITKITKKRLAV